MRTAAHRCLVLGLGILLTRASASSGALPDLSGTWKLNPAQSDDPQQVFREGGGGSSGGSDPGDSPPASGGSSGWGGHHGGGHGGHGRRGGGEGGSGGTSWLEGRERLVIVHSDPKLEITDAAGKERTVYTDGRKIEEERSYGGTTVVRAVWTEGHVEITSRPEKGPKIVQTLAVSADGKLLTVTLHIEGRRTLTIRSVYDAVREAPATAEPEPPADVEVTPAAGAGGR